MFHGLLVYWFELVRDWGYVGVAVLMAMESSIFPVPSEIVVPPAAFWAAQGNMNFWGVILASTVGSYIGSALTYLLARILGLPFLNRFGRYFFMPPDKITLAEKWIQDYSVMGVFFARLLPVLRHLVSIPAGVLKMNFWAFSVATVVGAFLWSVVLAYFGRDVIGAHPELLNSPEALVSALKDKLKYIIMAILLLSVATGFVLSRKKRVLAHS